jgi:hypothetical protein
MGDKGKREVATEAAVERAAAARGNGIAPEGNVDQIRDILFGGQMRDYERRFHDLEERIRRESDKLRQDLLKRMDGLEELLRDQAERFGSQLVKLDREWREAGEQAGQQQVAQHRQLKADLAALEQKHGQDLQGLRERLHKLGNEAGEALRQRADDLLVELEKRTGELRDDKVARAELAGFLTEMALRLNREFELPGTARTTRG